MIYVLNSPILTSMGVFKYSEISIEDASSILGSNNFTSAVGHQSTAEVMSRILKVEIPTNRVRIQMEPGDRAIVFQLRTRLPEGRVLSKEELESLPFTLGLLEMTKGAEKRREGSQKRLSVVLPSGGNNHRQRNLYKILLPHPPRSYTVEHVGGGSWGYSKLQYLLPENTLILFYYHSTHPDPGVIRLCRVKEGESCEPTLPGVVIKNLEGVECASTSNEEVPLLYKRYSEELKELAEESSSLSEALERWEAIQNI